MMGPTEIDKGIAALLVIGFFSAVGVVKLNDISITGKLVLSAVSAFSFFAAYKTIKWAQNENKRIEENNNRILKTFVDHGLFMEFMENELLKNQEIAGDISNIRPKLSYQENVKKSRKQK